MHHRLISSYQGFVGLLTVSECIWGTFHVDYTAIRKRKLQAGVCVCVCVCVRACVLTLSPHLNSPNAWYVIVSARVKTGYDTCELLQEVSYVLAINETEQLYVTSSETVQV